MTDKEVRLIFKLECLIKEDTKYNRDNDSWCWSTQCGVLITANEAKLIIKMITEIKANSNESTTNTSNA